MGQLHIEGLEDASEGNDFQINYLKESPGCHRVKQGWPNSVPTVARGDFEKEEMLALSLGVGIKPAEEKIKEEKDILG